MVIEVFNWIFAEFVLCWLTRKKDELRWENMQFVTLKKKRYHKYVGHMDFSGHFFLFFIYIQKYMKNINSTLFKMLSLHQFLSRQMFCIFVIPIFVFHFLKNMIFGTSTTQFRCAGWSVFSIPIYCGSYIVIGFIIFIRLKVDSNTFQPQ